MNEYIPNSIRRTILKMSFNGATAHIGSAFSIVEILSILYGKFLEYPNNNPESSQRDYLVLSKGHGVMAQYACMFERGWLDNDDIDNYFANGTNLMGLSDSRVPGLEVTSGSLGHGFSVGAGLALGIKMQQENSQVYVLVGDGELNEGTIWEAALFSSHHQLENLMVIIDANNFQAMGQADSIMNLLSIEDKFQSFGFEVASCDGHSLQNIEDTICELKGRKSLRPRALIANTIKGYGVSFMAGNNEWHYKRLDDQLYASALEELS